MRLSATVQEERCPPQFLAETGVLAEVCRGRGLLDKIQKQVHVPRGRAGTYEICDFVLPLLAHAVSNNRYLKHTYQEMQGHEAVLAALWGRQNVPSRSALSCWAAQVPPAAVEALGSILWADLLEHGARGDVLGGATTGSGSAICSSTSTAPARQGAGERWCRARSIRRRAGASPKAALGAAVGASAVRWFATAA